MSFQLLYSELTCLAKCYASACFVELKVYSVYEMAGLLFLHFCSYPPYLYCCIYIQPKVLPVSLVMIASLNLRLVNESAQKVCKAVSVMDLSLCTPRLQS
jgi:hypothetical protein